MRTNVKQVISSFLIFIFVLFLCQSSFAQQPPIPSSSEEQRDSFDLSAIALASQEPVMVDESKITLELRGVDVLDVLKILSQRSNMNIVAGKNVQGLITIYLKEVNIREVLNTIVSALGLAFEERDGIVTVMTGQEYELIHGQPFSDRRITKAFKMKYTDSKAVQQVIQQLKGPFGKVILDERTNTLIVSDVPEILQRIEEAITQLDEPVVTKIFKLQYGSVVDIEPQLQDYITQGVGILKVDKRSNQISVTDQHEKMERLSKIIKALDIRPPQVLIEAQVVEVALFDAFRYGIDWSYVRNKLTNQFNGVNFAPQFDLSAPASNAGSGTLSTFTVKSTRFTKGLTDSVISILQNVGKTNTLSAPRLTVLNNEEAKLVDATKQPYVTSTVTQAQTSSATADQVQFIDVGVTLTVVPTISDNDTIVLKMKPEVSSRGTDFTYNTASAQVTSAFSRSIPVVSTQTLETTVIIKSGETLIVGGLIKDKQSKTLRKLPFVADIPWIGSLFRSETVDFVKTELVVFLTPYIVSGDVSTREHEKFLTSEGELIDYDKVGGDDYALGQKHSQGPFRLDNKPYWLVDGFKLPRYLPPADVYERAEPYQDRMNQFEGRVEGESLPESNQLSKIYEISLSHRVSRALESLELLSTFEGKIDMALLVRRDGILEDLSFLNKRDIKDRKFRRMIMQTVRNAGPFSEFPKGLDSEKELFIVIFEYRKAPTLPSENAISGSSGSPIINDVSQTSPEDAAHELARQT